MNILLSVAAGGAIGAVARHLFNVEMLRLLGPSFPWGTFGVNVIGSFVMGLCVGAAIFNLSLSDVARAFVTTGFLGGFTTFSAFSLDAARLLESGQFSLATVYTLGSVAGSVLALFIGLWIARAVFPA